MTVNINDGAWKKIMRAVVESGDWRAKVGVLASSGAGEPHAGGDATNAEIAIFQELGTRDIPARSFIGDTFRINKADELRTMITALSRRVVVGALDIKKAVSVLGAWGANAVKNAITQHDIPPPLAPATVEAKGSSKPLVDTGQLLGSISWQITDGPDEAE